MKMVKISLVEEAIFSIQYKQFNVHSSKMYEIETKLQNMHHIKYIMLKLYNSKIRTFYMYKVIQNII